MELPDRYNPNDVEAKIYEWWETKGHFKAQDTSTKPPFSVVLPPPNVTGSLHLGHALDHTLQDVLVRWHRMRGFNALWLPGTDHAGIATQSVVEKNLKKQGKPTRQEMGREKFVETVWQWRNEYGDRIYHQMRKLGDSCDWDRSVFTLDPGVSKAVRKVFVDLYRKGLIYRGKRLVNWSPALQTAISDVEVEHKDVKGSLYYIKYPIVGGRKGEVLIVATTRPETLLADAAVCVNPEDERFKDFIGSKVQLPLTNREIPVIADTHVDREFGTGVLKITPAHDFNDYEVGVRHSLPLINMLNADGTLNEVAESVGLKGVTVKVAREKVVELLEKSNLLEKIEPHAHSVGHCSRSGCVVEPYLSEQWFAKMAELSRPARHVVENGTIRFEPESWTKTYLHWMSIIQDWCVSRQLWWGHRIPAWYAVEDGEILVTEGDANKERPDKTWQQDEDVLDTWFSSALWPFTTMGWPEQTEAFKTFYPTSVLVTGHDIIFFWVSRMIMMGLEHTDDVPFRTILVHGLIRDAQGRKMSKSEGNAVDPIELIEKYGADSLRFTLLAQIASGKDLKFSEQRLEGYRNFMNKLWNGARFALQNMEGADFSAVQSVDGPLATETLKDLSMYDRWILTRLSQVVDAVQQDLQNYRFSDAVNALYSFVWNDFCDWYLEFTKPVFKEGTAAEKFATQTVMAHVLEMTLRLLHPFIPFITEELYQKIPVKGANCILAAYPTPQQTAEFFKSVKDERIAMHVELVKEVVSAIRNIRGENRMSPALKIAARLAPDDDQSQKVLGENKQSIMTLARLEMCEIGEAGDLSKCAVSVVTLQGLSVQVIVPLAGLVDFDEEIKRLQKAIEKLEKEQTGLQKRLENSSFIESAPPEIIQQAREQNLDIERKLESLKQSLRRLN